MAEEYLDLTKFQLDIIQDLCVHNPDCLPTINEKEIHQVIKSLNSGKSPDEMGLTAEHLKYSGETLLPTLVAIFNDIIRTKLYPTHSNQAISPLSCLYSLEVLPLTDTQIVQLQIFHISSLKRIQSLPERTASSAVQLLLGALPVQAEIHKRQLSQLHSIANSKNGRIK